MITLTKLKVFRSYKGDGDIFARTGGRKKDIISDADWHLIDILLQDATVINRRLGPEARTAQAWQRLKENSENEAVIKEILRLAESGI